jgi:hypothetical protein
MAKTRRVPPLLPPTWAPRFWRLVSRPMLTESTPDPDACWEWLGAVDSDGYGVFELNGSKQAHKVSYELKVGLVPKGHVLLHSCDNPPCVNYHHLSVGTQAENMQDMVAKGRHGNRYVSHTKSWQPSDDFDPEPEEE